ncbi:MAG: 2,3,4,5-tetrahydropyridine-2,6-dicarboxylate N-succinyltransferase, partial [Pseudomonadota bacterium]|nr:2,3,4,5-tetrahydropyridine-2,6-dicarboxylate N-succinyltransferase [Pseudomonadota bacterium]
MADLTLADLQAEIEAGWEARESLSAETRGPVRTAVEETLHCLDAGEARVAEKIDGAWRVNAWLRQAILLSFRLSPNTVMRAGALGGGIGPWWDKIPSKFDGWDEAQFEAAGFRAVPGAIVRRGAFIGRDAVLMPSFVNIGAHVGERTMIDTWATVGSCAQIGAGVHISGGAGIGGVLEPLQAAPTIVEDGAFIGARSEVAEGVIVGEGAVLAMGVFIAASTRIVDRKTGETH